MRTIIIMLALMGNMFIYAQKAETIESFVANKYETEWYAAQAVPSYLLSRPIYQWLGIQ